jgi:hypothetical protein
MRLTLIFLLTMLPSISPGMDCTARSGPNTAALIELYTSEGCDSCPPADRWLSGFAARSPSPLVVPLAFHVDYWDYLGWKDAFAEARYSERQRDFARTSGARGVFTPQVVLAGRDFSWRGSDPARAFETVQVKPARARLEIVADAGPSALVRATLSPGVRADDLALHVAITQNGLVTQVKAGENRGETLRHDFVVRDLKTERRWPGADRPLETRVEFSPRPDWQPARMSFVAFVQDVRTGEVLQALSAPLCTR